MKTFVVLNDWDTWTDADGAMVVRLPVKVEEAFRSHLENGLINEAMRDRKAERLDISTLVRLYDHLRHACAKGTLQDPALVRLVAEVPASLEIVPGKPTEVTHDARPD